MRIGAQKACQLFPGDHIGIIIPQDDESALKDLAGDQVKRFLKYKVEIIGMPDATKDEVVRRKYFQCDVETGLPTRQRERSPPPSDTNAVWAILREFTTEGRETNKKYQLRLKKTRFGRDRCCEVIINHTYVSREHCLFDWEPEERKAYLINRSTNGTFVNGEPCSGRFQLRDKDEIQLVKPSGIAGIVRRPSSLQAVVVIVGFHMCAC
ncbi:SMAD/FHA domain-containing protein [Mortierella sp. GBAus27b]|nr:SMAD/FHA domain-containing protein [Mortierella sp. GBAus27b]